MPNPGVLRPLAAALSVTDTISSPPMRVELRKKEIASKQGGVRRRAHITEERGIGPIPMQSYDQVFRSFGPGANYRHPAFGRQMFCRRRFRSSEPTKPELLACLMRSSRLSDY